MRLPPLAALRAFEVAARHQNLSAAGRELGVTHAAISQQVKRLEDLLGVSLLNRAGRGMALTPEGGRLAAALSEGFEVMRRAVADLVDAEQQRPLHVSMTPNFAVTWLMPRIGAFRASHPEVELMLNPSTQQVDLARDGYDLAIRFGRGEWVGLEAEPFIASYFAVVAAPSLLEGEAIHALQDLTRLPWLEQSGTEELVLWLAARGVDVSRKKSVTHLPGYMMLPALREGQGVACTAAVLVEEDVREGRLVQLFSDSPEPKLGYHLVRRPGTMRQALEKFVRWLRAEARAEASREQGEQIAREA